MSEIAELLTNCNYSPFRCDTPYSIRRLLHLNWITLCLLIPNPYETRDYYKLNWLQLYIKMLSVYIINLMDYLFLIDICLKKGGQE